MEKFGTRKVKNFRNGQSVEMSMSFTFVNQNLTKSIKILVKVNVKWFLSFNY